MQNVVHLDEYQKKPLILFLTEIVVGVVSSSILTDEPFGWREIVGSSMIILGGILAVVLAPKEEEKVTA